MYAHDHLEGEPTPDERGNPFSRRLWEPKHCFALPTFFHLFRKVSGTSSEMCCTKWTFILFRTSAGTSSQSFRFWSGNMISFNRERAAASTFSLIPPTRKTRPRR